MRKWLFFTLVAFLMALVHSCSMNNDILKPNCTVFQFDLAEKWWTPTGGGATDRLYFTSGGIVKQEGNTDSIGYVLQNCNSLVIHNYNTGETKDWKIQTLVPNQMTVQIDVAHPSATFSAKAQ